MKKLVLIFIAAYCALFALAMGCARSPIAKAYHMAFDAKHEFHYIIKAQGIASAQIGAHAPEK